MSAQFGLEDVLVLEQGGSEDEEAVSMQKAINSGMWSLQGSYGRSMMAAIEAGRAMLGKPGARDAYGNYIPCRAAVKAGTKGSYDYVAEAMGVEYADQMEAV